MRWRCDGGMAICVPGFSVSLTVHTHFEYIVLYTYTYFMPYAFPCQITKYDTHTKEICVYKIYVCLCFSESPSDSVCHHATRTLKRYEWHRCTSCTPINCWRRTGVSGSKGVQQTRFGGREVREKGEKRDSILGTKRLVLFSQVMGTSD